jgi:hypothetical protein
MATIPIIPTLDTQGILSDPRDIMAYILHYYTTAPKSVSDSTPASMISLLDDISTYQSNANALANAATRSLQAAFANFYPASSGNSASVTVETSDNGDDTYNLIIQVSVRVNTVPYTLGADVSISPTGTLQLKYHPTLL